MSRLESSPPLKTLFGPVFWIVLGLGLFAFFWFQTGPSADIRLQMDAAGPGGVTSYFESPETAIARATVLSAERDWARLARYYDLSGSGVRTADLLNGRYFAGPGGPRPFPPGYRIVGTERIAHSDFVRATLAGDFKVPGDFTSGRTIEVFFIRSPEGYRFVPEDAAPLRAALAQ